uniref:Uncharacterized protein n=1 Tax=OCS116 cluster bacterium TaxID=2030921 RepID=A0A2A4YZ28_9PROT
MAFNIFALLPKWVLLALGLSVFTYYLGISHGRAPYKLAAKLQNARAEIIIKHTDKIRDMIEQKGKLAYEIFDNNECVINDVDAQRLSDIIGS